MTVSTDPMGTVGVAGCGAMGLPMARRLLAAGFDVLGFDVRPHDAFGDFAQRMVLDPDAFAAQCEVVISVVRDARQTHDLCFDQQGICRAGTSLHTLVVSSTLAPAVVAQVRERLDPAIRLVDAPMSGAPFGAESGTLTFMLGGEADDVARCMPLFEAMGARHFHCGPLGHGMTIKVLNNYVAVSSVVAVRRVLDTAVRLGIDTCRLREIMSKSSGATWYGDRFESISWARDGYDSGNTIGILEKDLAAAMEAINDAADANDNLLEEALVASLRSLEPYGSD
jgi:3-hydroxyisobutyrate dehydrogenase